MRKKLAGNLPVQFNLMYSDAFTVAIFCSLKKSLRSLRYLQSAVVLAVPAIFAVSPAMPVIPDPDWSDSDLFKLNKVERDKLRGEVSKKLGIAWKVTNNPVQANLGVVWAYKVAGIEPYNPAAADVALKAYNDTR